MCCANNSARMTCSVKNFDPITMVGLAGRPHDESSGSPQQKHKMKTNPRHMCGKSPEAKRLYHTGYEERLNHGIYATRRRRSMKPRRTSANSARAAAGIAPAKITASLTI